MVIQEPTKDQYSLYFHIPFCTKKCAYCHFYVLPDKSLYHTQLAKAIALDWNRLEGVDQKKLVSIYFGGGTPTLFGVSNIQNILEKIGKDMTSMEVTIETNPDNVTVEMIKNLKDIGINRISIGVQSLDDKLLKTLTRTHCKEKAKEAIYTIKEAGIDNISIDLMYEVPEQTFESWQNTLAEAVELPISHISLYNLTFEPNTLFYKKKHLLKPYVPSEKTSKKMFIEAINVFEGAGFIQYEISAFAKENLYSRHNTGYWLARPFLGFGPSAFSDWNGCRYKTVSHLKRYLDLLENGLEPIDFSETLSKDQRIKELFAINLRLLQGVNIPSFEKRHGKILSELMKSLKEVQKACLIEIDQDTVRMTRKGMLLYDTLCSMII